MLIQGQEKHYKYGHIFTHEWLYITIIGESECKVKINSKFKEIDYKKPQGNEEQQTLLPNRDAKKDEQEITIDDFSLGDGPMNIRMGRVTKFVDQLIDDEKKFKEFIQKPKMEQIEKDKLKNLEK